MSINCFAPTLLILTSSSKALTRAERRRFTLWDYCFNNCVTFEIDSVVQVQLMVDEGCKFSNDSCKFRSIPRKITVLLGLLVQHTSLHAETSVPAESLS